MKVKDLLNHMAAYSDITAAVVYHHSVPVDTIPFPVSLRTPRTDEYDNDRLYSFAILGNTIRLNVEHKAFDDPDQARIDVRYAYPFGRNGHEHTVSFHVVTERQAEHVRQYVKNHAGRGAHLID